MCVICKTLAVFERDVMRKIIGRIEENNFWRIITNFWINQEYRDYGILQFIKMQRIRWAGYLVQMGEDQKESWVDRRWAIDVGGEQESWRDNVRESARELPGIGHWQAAEQDQYGWRHRLMEVRAQWETVEPQEEDYDMHICSKNGTKPPLISLSGSN